MPYVVKGHARFNKEKNCLQLWADPIETAVWMDEETADAYASAGWEKFSKEVNPSESRTEK